MQTPNNEEQEQIGTSMGLFIVLHDMFKPKINEAVLLLQYCKLTRGQEENPKE